VLGVGPTGGRTFRTDDPPSVAVIGERAWRQHFNGDSRVVERTVTLDGVVFSIVGVMQGSFEFLYCRTESSVASMPSGARTEVWVRLPPLLAAAGGKPRRGRVEVVARASRPTAKWGDVTAA
jgi:MacB-like periplasmic core domain